MSTGRGCSLTRATTPINMFVSWDETQNTNDDKLVKTIQRMMSVDSCPIGVSADLCSAGAP